MQNDGELGQSLGDLLQHVKAELRLGAGLELICAVAGADGDCQGVNTGAGDEFLHLVGVGEHSVLGLDLYVVLNACQLAKLTLYHHAVCVSIFHDLAGQCDVVLKGMVRAVDHDRSKAAVDASLADLEICAVVKVKGQVDIGIADRSLCQSHEIFVLCVLTCACGYLQDDGGLLFLSSLGDRLDNFHVVDVESADRVAAAVSLLKHFCGCNKCHFGFPPVKNSTVILS